MNLTTVTTIVAPAVLAATLALAAVTATGAAQQVPTRPAGATPPAPPPLPPIGSNISVEPPIVELGAIEPGSTHPAKFVLRNKGTDPIRVLDAVPNCKCTAISDVKGKTIPPGGTLELSASLAAPRAPGVKEATVLLAFDRSAPVAAKIRGDVRLKVVAEPSFADALKETVRGTVKLRSADGKPFAVTRSGGRPPVFVGFDPAKDAPRAEYEVVWDLSGIPCEAMPLWWFVFTDRADCPAIPLRVRDECTGSKHDQDRFKRFWIVKESLVDAGNAMNGKANEVEIDLEHYNPPKRGAVERPEWRDVKSVRSLSPSFDAAFVSKKDVGADGCLVKVALTPKVVGEIEGELEIETATGKGRVPVTMFSRTW